MDREILLRQLVQAEQDAAAKAKKTAAGVTGSVGQQKKDKSIKGSVSDVVKSPRSQVARPAPIKARQQGSILKLSPKASFYVSRMTAAARYSRAHGTRGQRSPSDSLAFGPPGQKDDGLRIDLARFPLRQSPMSLMTRGRGMGVSERMDLTHGQV